ncbi:LysR substrate-binding domain-containing protein [Mesorhizobium sp. M0955]|uniref:LysR family transcriptional regulator n=1 Tax=unclassified Mesorhizobium TaxID=325217 RepID=UPI00333DB54B
MAVHLNFRQISVLHAIVRGGSASAAAESLHVSQPAVSKLVAATEAELGYRLFRRSGRRLEPTTEAVALMPHIERVLSEMGRLRRSAEVIGRGTAGTVSVSGNYTLISAVAAEAAIRFREIHPDVALSLLILSPQDVVASVITRQVDIGLAYGPLHNSQLEIEDIGRWSCVCVFPRTHRLEPVKEVGPSDLLEESILTYSDSSPTGIAIRQLFERAQLDLRTTFVLGNTPMILDLVRRGQGVGLIDAFSPFARGYPELIARPLRPQIENVPKLLTYKSTPPEGTVPTLIECIRSIASNLQTNAD